MDLLIHYVQIVLLGIVEGVTEFLPISSTGHLLIAEHFLGGQQPDIFNVVIQAGAILAVVFIYWNKLVVLFTHLHRSEAREYLLKVFLAFVVTSVTYFGISKLVGHHGLTTSLSNVAWATLIGGLVIFAVEAFAKHLYAHDDVSWVESVLVGLGQVVAALLPGASRSGSTIMAGLAVGMKRPVVTEYSFIVGIPTMFAASAYSIVKDRKDLHGIGHQLIIDTVIGFVVSAIVAFFVVKWLLRFVQSHTFNGFATYRVILGLVLLIAIKTNTLSDEGKETQPTIQTPKDVPVLAPAPAATTNPATNSVPAPAPMTNTNMTNPATNAMPAVGTNGDGTTNATPSP